MVVGKLHLSQRSVASELDLDSRASDCEFHILHGWRQLLFLLAALDRGSAAESLEIVRNAIEQ